MARQKETKYEGKKLRPEKGHWWMRMREVTAVAGVEGRAQMTNIELSG